MGLGMGVVVGGGDGGVEEMVGSHNHPFSRHASFSTENLYLHNIIPFWNVLKCIPS